MFNNRLINSIESTNESYDKLLNELDFDYSAIYRGIVVDNEDPLKLGRVKVRVPQIHGSEDDRENKRYQGTYAIPWATSAVMVGAGNNTGAYLIPNVGDVVYVTFEGANAKLPIYFGGIINKTDGGEKIIGTDGVNASQYYTVKSDDANTDITNLAQRVIYKSIKGATIIIDDSDENESIKILDQLGQIISLENNSGELLDRDRDNTALGTTHHKRGKIVLQNSNGSSITISNDEILLKAPKVRLETDSFEVIDSESELEPENNLADIILGNTVNSESNLEPNDEEVIKLHQKIEEILDYRESDIYGE